MSSNEKLDKRSVEAAIAEYNVLVDYAENVRESINTITSLIRDAEATRNELNQLKDQELPAELLIPLGSIAFLRVKVENIDKVMVNLGAGIYREVDIDDAISRVEDYIKNLGGELERLNNLYNQLILRIGQLETEISKAAREKGRQ